MIISTILAPLGMLLVLTHGNADRSGPWPPS